MLDAKLLPPARDDFDESYAWYAKRSEDAAERFASAIDSALEKLCNDPNVGIRIDDDHWFYRLKKSFPFYLVYRVEPTKIVILAVAHKPPRAALLAGTIERVQWLPTAIGIFPHSIPLLDSNAQRIGTRSSDAMIRGQV